MIILGRDIFGAHGHQILKYGPDFSEETDIEKHCNFVISILNYTTIIL